MSNLSKRSIRPRANTVNPPAKKSLAFVWPASASVTPLCAADCPRASPVRRVVSECLQEREQRIGGLAAARAHGSERACDLAGVRAAFVRWLGACGVRGEEPASALVGLADRIATDVSQCAAAETGARPPAVGAAEKCSTQQLGRDLCVGQSGSVPSPTARGWTLNPR